jgi:glycosyltransferase involved in cell wall biosynthesis
MRIVMVCPESPLPGGLLFDRRIMQEGKTLHQAGHDVYLIAKPGANLPPTFTTDGIHVILFDDAIPQIKPEASKLNLRPTVISRVKNRILNSRIGRYIRRFNQIWESPRTPAQTPEISAATARVTNLTYADDNLIELIVRLKPDCVVAHDLPVLRPVVAAGKVCNARVAYDSHEFYSEQASLSLQDQEYLRQLETYWLQWVDLVYTVNPLLSDLMSKIYKRPVHCITNAIDPPQSLNHQKQHHLHRDLGLSSADKILLYQGGFAARRGLENLIDAMNYVSPPIHLAFLGYGDYKVKLEEIVREKGLCGRVHFVNPRTQADLLEWTASADAGIIPYHIVDKNAWCVSPNKMFEYITARLPFLSNELPFVRMTVDDLQCGMVADLTTPATCGAAINRMFSNPEQLQRMHQNLQDRGAEYSWAKQGVKLLQLYEAIGVRHEPLRFAA